MNSIERDTVLLIIDVQKGIEDPVWEQRNNLQAEQNIGRLLHLWRETNRPVYHVQHLSQKPNSPLRSGYVESQIKDIVKPLPGEPSFKKT